MSDSYEIARDFDRVMRQFDARLHRRAVAVDRDKVGQLGGLVLLSLAEAYPISVQGLSQKMGRDKSQMTRLIQLLEGKGVIARTPSPDDGRVSLLEPTEKGHALIEALRGVMSEVMDEIVAPLSADERAVLARLLRAV
ncbi:MAG: MarR family transcriptional regulator [Pseudomonadota bacterium]